MKTAAGFWALFVCIAIAALSVGCVHDEPGSYVPGGRNIETSRYARTDGNPEFPDKALFVGTLSGDWYGIGSELGKRAGASTRLVSDKWWREMCEMYGKDETLRAFDLYEAEIAALDPGMVDLMRGIADGAQQWLSESPYADPEHELHASGYQRVLAVNVWDEWAIMHPREFPDGSSTFGGAVQTPMALPHQAGCSAFAARGAATSDGATIAAHNRHSPYDPRCYEQVFVLSPNDGYACWVLSNAPQVTGNQVVNEHGVTLALLAGGITNPVSLGFDGGPYVAEAFGVPWFHLFVWVGTHARTAEEAITMLTKGPESYRERTGRESLLRCGGWVFLVADDETLAVVEATADRYAVRYAGDLLAFTGPEWTDENYIVATNHYVCDFSYDAQNRRTDVPMTIFNEGYWRDRETGEIEKLTESGVRFWTLMWDVKHHYGQLDRYRAQQIMSGLYAYDDKTGEKIEVAQADDGSWHIFGRVNDCTAGFASFGAGTCDGKIAVADETSTSVFWTMGNPIHWQGAWDAYRFE